MFNLVEYINSHYYPYYNVNFSEEQKKYFLDNIKLEDNALYIIEKARLKKEVMLFLYQNLGHFTRLANSEQMIVDYIVLGLEKELNDSSDLYSNQNLREKWEFIDYQDFQAKMNNGSIPFLKRIYPKANKNYYEMIFGNTNIQKSIWQYIYKISDYLKSQGYTFFNQEVELKRNLELFFPKKIKISEREKEEIQEYIETPNKSKQISYDLQKEEIKEEFPHGIFPDENISLHKYISNILCNFPNVYDARFFYRCILDLIEQENYYLNQTIYDLYTRIGNMYNKNNQEIIKELNNYLENYYFNIDINTRNEIFFVPTNATPTNEMFFINIIDYIKNHYYTPINYNFTEIQKDYFLSQIPEEYNAKYILQLAELKKEISKFLQLKLGHNNSTPNTQVLLADCISYYMCHSIKQRMDLLKSIELQQKWGIKNQEDIKSKMANLAASLRLKKNQNNIDTNTYIQIFGQIDANPSAYEYIKGVGDYLNEQEYIKKLKK